MSDHFPHSPELSALVQQLADAVLAQLGVGASEATRGGGAGGGGTGDGVGDGVGDRGSGAAAPGHRLGWLLAAPSGHLETLSREMSVLQRLGHSQRLVACADVAAALGPLGAVEPPLVLGEPGAASAALAAVGALDLLYLGSLGWSQARRLAALDDGGAGGGDGDGGAVGPGGDPVALVLEALSRGVTVRMVAGEGLGGLHGFSPGNRATGRLAAEAARLWRELEALGISPVSPGALGRPLAALAAERDSFGRALGGLLSEKDVEAAVAEGRRELRLPRGTVVTPLARERARGLGLALHRE